MGVRFEVFHGSRQGQEWFEGCHDGQGDHGQGNAVGTRILQAGYERAEDRDDGCVHEQAREGLVHAVKQGVAVLKAEHAGFIVLHPGKVGGKFSVDLQFSYALQEIEGKDLPVCFQFHDSSLRSSAEGDDQQRDDDARKQMEKHDKQCGLDGPGAEKEHHHQGNEGGGQRWSKHPRIDVFEALDIVHHTLEQVAAPEVEQPCRSEGLDGIEEPESEFRKYSEGRAVRNQPFGVAEHPAGDSEEPHTDDAELQGSEGRLKSGFGDEVAGGDQKPYAASCRCETDERRDRHPEVIRPDNGREAEKCFHAAASCWMENESR